MESTDTRTVRFGSFELDVRLRELRTGSTRVRLQDQPFEILRLMLERPGEVITREELQQRLWPDGTFVDFEHSLNAAVKRLRAALGDSADNPRFVETLPRRGYRFIAPVSGPGVEPVSVPVQPSVPAAPPVVAPDLESVEAVPAETIVAHAEGLGPIGRRAILLVVLGAAVLAATGAAV